MNISNAEIELMKVLWVQQPLTVGQIIERVSAANDWHDNTIKTMLNRLVKKTAVSRHRDGGRYFYAPCISQDEFLTSESEGLLQRFFEGRMAPLIAHLASQDKLSSRDVAEIEALLQDMKDRDE